MAVSRHQPPLGDRFQADCDASLAVGECVRYDTPTGSLPKVVLTDPTGHVSVGIVTEKISTTLCVVVRFGIVDVSGFITPSANTHFWVSLTGVLTTTPPSPGAGAAFVQFAGTGQSSTKIHFDFDPHPPKRRA